MYANTPIANVDIKNEVFALDSTTISLSIKLFSWASGKYSRGAIKVHTMLDLRGSISTFIFIFAGKYHDSNVLDEILPLPGAIYLMDKAYIDFASLYKMHNTGSYFITRAKVTLDYQITAGNFNIDEQTGLRSDRTFKLNGPKSRRLYPEPLRMDKTEFDYKNTLGSFRECCKHPYLGGNLNISHSSLYQNQTP